MRFRGWRRYGGCMVLGFLILVLYSFYPGVLSPGNVSNVFAQSAIVGICASGMTFVIVTGGIDLSVGSLVALSGTVGAWLNAAVHCPWPLAWAGAIAVAITCGLLSGSLVYWGKVPPFMATLAMMSIARGLTLLLSAGYPISGLDESFYTPGWDSFGPIPIAGIIMISMVVLAWVILKRTPLGSSIYSVGDNSEAARLSGISSGKVILTVYGISGLCAGVAGLLLVGRLWSAQPNAAIGLELDVIAAVVIGGTSLFGGVGSPLGTLIGVMVMGFLGNGLRLLEISSYFQQVIKGIVFISAVALDLFLKGAYRRGRSRDE